MYKRILSCFYINTIILFLSCFQNIYSVESEKIILHYIERPPYFILEEGTNKLNDGIIYNLAVKILTTAKIQYEFNNVPFIRSIIEIKENKIKICSPSALKNKEREEFAYFSKPIFQDKKTVIIIRKNDDRFKKYSITDEILKDSNFIILLRIGFSYGVYLDNKVLKYKNIVLSELHPNKQKGTLFSSENNNSMLNDILEKKADYMFMGRNEAEYLIGKKSEFKKLLTIKQLRDQPEGEKRYFMCSKSVGIDKMNKINKAISKIVK